MVVQGEVDKVTEKRERKELSQQLQTPATHPPTDVLPATSGEPVRVWVDETLHDGRVVAGLASVSRITAWVRLTLALPVLLVTALVPGTAGSGTDAATEVRP